MVAKRPPLDGLIMAGSHAGASVAGGSKGPASDTVCYARLQHSRPPPAAAPQAAAPPRLRLPLRFPGLDETPSFLSSPLLLPLPSAPGMAVLCSVVVPCVNRRCPRNGKARRLHSAAGMRRSSLTRRDVSNMALTQYQVEIITTLRVLFQPLTNRMSSPPPRPRHDTRGCVRLRCGRGVWSEGIKHDSSFLCKSPVCCVLTLPDVHYCLFPLFLPWAAVVL